MKFKTLAVALLATTLIGCADKIEVPEENPTIGSGKIVYNAIDIDAEQDNYADMIILDSTNKPVTSLGLGAVWSTGINTIPYAVPASEISSRPAYIYITDNAGVNDRKIADVTAPGQRLVMAPLVSHNGAIAAYITNDSVTPTIWKRRLRTVRTDGIVQRVISEEIASETLPALSPDGSKIAFFKKVTDDIDELVVANTDGSGSTTIVSNLKTGHDLSSTIDWGTHNKIAYSIFNDQPASIWVVNPDGTGHVQVGSGMMPAWSIGGEKLAWVALSQDKDNAEIVYTRDLGITIDTLTSSDEGETHPQFSPDGTKLICTIWVEDPMESRGRLKLIDVETKAASIIAEPAYSGYWLK